MRHSSEGAQRLRLAIGGRQHQHLYRVRAPGTHLDPYTATLRASNRWRFADQD